MGSGVEFCHFLKNFIVTFTAGQAPTFYSNFCKELRQFKLLSSIADFSGSLKIWQRHVMCHRPMVDTSIFY